MTEAQISQHGAIKRSRSVFLCIFLAVGKRQCSIFSSIVKNQNSLKYAERHSTAISIIKMQKKYEFSAQHWVESYLFAKFSFLVELVSLEWEVKKSKINVKEFIKCLFFLYACDRLSGVQLWRCEVLKYLNQDFLRSTTYHWC